MYNTGYRGVTELNVDVCESTRAGNRVDDR